MKSELTLGLKENWQQFFILVVVNAFVGGMVGLERTIFPKFAEEQFGIASKTATADLFGVSAAILLIGFITLVSAFVILIRLPKKV